MRSNTSYKEQEEKRLAKKCFYSFSKKFSSMFKNEKHKDGQPTNWWYWYVIVDKKYYFYFVSRVKGYVYDNQIINDDNKEHNTKKLSKFKNKLGYYVITMVGVEDIKNPIDFQFKLRKIYRKTRKRVAMNLAHKLWFEKYSPDGEYRPLYAETKRKMSETTREKMIERGKNLFQKLSEKRQLICPRCDHNFVYLGKILSVECPSCKSKFVKREKVLDKVTATN